MGENAETVAVAAQVGDAARAELYKEQANECFKSRFTWCILRLCDSKRGGATRNETRRDATRRDVFSGSR